ncbi:unnamed protein product [Ixodes pacificus]
MFPRRQTTAQRGSGASVPELEPDRRLGPVPGMQIPGQPSSHRRWLEARRRRPRTFRRTSGTPGQRQLPGHPEAEPPRLRKLLVLRGQLGRRLRERLVRPPRSIKKRRRGRGGRTLRMQGRPYEAGAGAACGRHRGPDQRRRPQCLSGNSGGAHAALPAPY